MQKQSGRTTIAVALALIGVLWTTVLLRNTPGTSDVDIWFQWADVLRAEGLPNGYGVVNADYPPGVSVFLYTAVATAPAFDLTPSANLKLWLAAILLVVAGIVFVRTGSPGTAVAAYAACLLNAVGLLYLDVLTAPFLVMGFAAARRGSWPQLLFWLSCASAVKYQPALLLPFALIFSIKRQQTTPLPGASYWPWLIGICALWGGLALVFGLHNLTDSFFKASRHNMLSSFAANPLWVLTWVFQAANGRGAEVVDMAPASRPMLRVLMLISVALYGYVLHRYWRSGDDSFSSLCRFSLCGFLAYVLAAAGVHENHLFTPALIAVLFASESRPWWSTAAVLVVAANVNLIAFYGFTGYIERRVVAIDLTVWVAVFVSALLIGVFRNLLRGRIDGEIAHLRVAPEYRAPHRS